MTVRRLPPGVAIRAPQSKGRWPIGLLRHNPSERELTYGTKLGGRRADEISCIVELTILISSAMQLIRCAREHYPLWPVAGRGHRSAGGAAGSGRQSAVRSRMDRMTEVSGRLSKNERRGYRRIFAVKLSSQAEWMCSAGRGMARRAIEGWADG